MRLLEVSHGVAPADHIAVGSISSHVGTLCDALGRLPDVETTLIAHPDSNVDDRVRLVALPESTVETTDKHVQQTLAQTEVGDYTAIHGHIKPNEGNLRSLAVAGASTLTFLGIHIDPNVEESRALQQYPDVALVAYSASQAERLPELNWLGIVNHGVDTAHLHPPETAPTSDAALVIGKIYEGKATHLGVKAALNAGLRVNVVGPIIDTVYFARYVAPLIDDKRVSYRGVVSNGEKRQLYGETVVTVCPSQLNETFGLVPIESMACGTPVAALPAGGSYEEILSKGGGICVDDPTDLVEAISSAIQVSRTDTRQVAERYFSAATMAQAYVELVKQHTT